MYSTKVKWLFRLGQPSGDRRHLPILGATLLLAGVLRLWGLDYGLPQFLYPDETKYIGVAQTYLEDRQIVNPHYFHNPPLFSHVVLATAAVLDLLRVPLGEREHIVMVSRALSAVVGTGSVALLFLIGMQLGGRSVGLVAASLLAVNLLAVRSSHTGVNDMMMLVLLLVCLYAFCVGVSGQDGVSKLHRGLVLAAFIGGLATSTKYNAAIAVLPLGVFMLVRWTGWARTGLIRQRWLDILREGGAVGGWFVLGVLAGNPWILHTPKEVWEGFPLFAPLPARDLFARGHRNRRTELLRHSPRQERAVGWARRPEPVPAIV